MNTLLAKWLDKLKVKNVNDLSSEEKATFDKWESILSEGEMTVDKIKEFCKTQKAIIETQYSNPDNSSKKDSVLKASLGFYNALIGIIESPKAEKEALEKHLIQLIK